MTTKLPLPSTTPLAAALASLLIISGCATVPEPIAPDQFKSIAAADKLQARQGVEPLTTALTLEDAIARGLKYNLDHRTRLLEQALASGQLDASRFDMLPRVLASAGYQSRDKSSNTYSPLNGKPSSTEAPVSADNSHTTTDLGLSWNILDFGISYYNSQQNADRVLVAAERRRKAMHQLIQNIRSAFWRVASAQRLRADVTDTIHQAETALANSRQISLERVKAPIEALRFQRSLLENLRTLEGIERELSAARIELAQLINLPAGSEVRIAEPASFALDERLLGVDIEHLEEMAIANNADLREQFYATRIAATETRKALLRLFPGLTLSYTSKHDSNSYLVHPTWNETATQISFNLINLLSGPSQMDVAESAARLAEQRRMAMQMAVVAQLHLARQDFDTALRQFRRADAIWDVDQQLFEQTARGEAEKTQSPLAKIATRTAAILSQLRRYQSLAQAHTATSRLQATLGLEPTIGNLDELSLADLRQTVAGSLNDWERLGVMTTPVTPPPAIPAATPVAEQVTPPAAQPAPAQEAAVPPAPTSGANVLTAIRFVGNESVNSDELAAAYADLIGKPLHEFEFARLPRRAEEVYRAKGITQVSAVFAGRTGDGVVTLRLKNLPRP